MTEPDWTAPEVDRPAVPPTAGERETLQAMLDFHRATLLHKCSGLGRDDLVRRSVEPSRLSLLGLVRHLADVERWWFRRQLAGEEIDGRFGPDHDLEADIEGVDDADPQADIAAFWEEVAAADATAARFALDDTFHNRRRDTRLSLRWVYVHMIEEYARHNGHADLLRERVDGATGY